MNVVPGLHSTVVSVPKLADAVYTTVLSKKGAAIYDDHTTTITANKPPVLEANRCNLTGLWNPPLHPEGIAANVEPPHNEAINVIFNLPSVGGDVYIVAGITKLGEQVARNTKLE
jgi:hypothetical protein